MEQLSFDFVQDVVTQKEFNIHNKLNTKRLQRGTRLVHVSTQPNFDIRINDIVHVTSTDRHSNMGSGLVVDIWKGKLKDLPASWLAEYESVSMMNYQSLLSTLFPNNVSNKDNVEITAIKYYHLND